MNTMLKGPRGLYRIISEDIHKELLSDYLTTDITVKELAAKHNVNSQSLRKLLSGYMFHKPKREGLRGRTPKNVTWRVKV